MDILGEKFEIYRDVILSEMDVNNDLLRLMMERHLIDAAESAKYKAINKSRTRNEELMTGLIERRTDRAYPIFLDCLRKSGQSKIADLLTDVTKEEDLTTKTDSKVDRTSNTLIRPSTVILPKKPRIPSEMELIREVNDNLDALLKDLSPFLTKEEKRIGLETNDDIDQQPETGKRSTGGSRDQSLEAESQQAEQQLWQNVHSTMVAAINEIGRCQTIINKLHHDCQAVADVNSEIAAQIKDCDNTIRNILITHRLPVADVHNPQRTTELFQMLMDDIQVLSEGRNRLMLREKETRSQSMRMLRMFRDWLDERCNVLNQLYATTTSSYRYPQSSTRLSVHNSTASTSLATSPAESRQGDLPSLIEARPISSVIEGLSLLEHQLRDYIHLERFLTDKYRSDLRIKQLQKKAQGYTSKGFFNVKQYVDSIEQGVDVDESLENLKGVLVKLSEEYDQCVHYMKRMTTNMQREGPTKVGSTKSPEQTKTESKHGRFKKKPKEPVNEPALRLPRLVPENTFSHLEFPGETVRGKPLLLRLKTLVANYESAKNSENMMAQKFHQDWDKKKKDLTDIIRKKEEEILNIHFRLKEMTADRDKYRKLYEQAKASVGRKG